MKNSEKILSTLFSALIVLLIFVYSLKVLAIQGNLIGVDSVPTGKLVERGDPAGVFCIQSGGKILTKTNSNGDLENFCVFFNGKECPLWDFYELKCYK